MRNIILLYGGRSYEHDISVISAVQLGELWGTKDNLIPVYMREGAMWVVREWTRYTSYMGRIKGKPVRFEHKGVRVGGKYIAVDAAILATHGGEGEDGTLQALLEYHRIPYTSCDMLTSAVCMDKIMFKTVLSALGYAVVQGGEATPDKVPSLPAVCKPARLGSSIGIDVARTEEEWRNAYYHALEYDSRVLYETFVEGAKEYNQAAVWNGEKVVLSAIERPAYSGDTYTFGEKYKCECAHELPAAIGEQLAQKICRTTDAVYRSLGLWGVVRVDYLYDGENLYINEINTVPGSLSYRLFAAAGIPLVQLMEILVRTARVSVEPKTQYAALLGELVGTYK
jgi:D-alanine-D-alanine ligase